jgi:hypothetical protein
MSEDESRRIAGADEPQDELDVEAHGRQKGPAANAEPSQEGDDGDDVEAHSLRQKGVA